MLIKVEPPRVPSLCLHTDTLKKWSILTGHQHYLWVVLSQIIDLARLLKRWTVIIH